MPSRVSIGKRSQLLEERKSELRKTLDGVLKERKLLLLRHHLLQALCESLSLMQVHKMSKGTWNMDDGSAEFEQLLEREVSLLNQLTNSPVSSMRETARVVDVGVPTIAPAGEPMAYFKHVIEQPQLATAATITAADIASIARECTLQIAVQLHLLQDLPAQEHAAACGRLQDAYDRIVVAAMSCLAVGRQDVVESINVLNMQSMEADVEGAVRQAGKVASLIDKLELTQQQQHVIATGSSMYMRLLCSVSQERQRLQAQVAAMDKEAPAAAVGSSTSGSRPDDTNDSTSTTLRELEALEIRPEVLEKQQQQVARLQLVLQKEFFMRMAGMTWFVGCLSWQQLSKAVVLSWPYAMRPLLLAQAIQRRHEGNEGKEEEQEEQEEEDGASQQCKTKSSAEVPSGINGAWRGSPWPQASERGWGCAASQAEAAHC